MLDKNLLNRGGSMGGRRMWTTPYNLRR